MMFKKISEWIDETIDGMEEAGVLDIWALALALLLFALLGYLVMLYELGKFDWLLGMLS